MYLTILYMYVLSRQYDLVHRYLDLAQPTGLRLRFPCARLAVAVAVAVAGAVKIPGSSYSLQYIGRAR